MSISQSAKMGGIQSCTAGIISCIAGILSVNAWYHWREIFTFQLFVSNLSFNISILLCKKYTKDNFCFFIFG